VKIRIMIGGWTSGTFTRIAAFRVSPTLAADRSA
jgi:hypothetical protein